MVGGMVLVFRGFVRFCVVLIVAFKAIDSRFQGR